MGEFFGTDGIRGRANQYPLTPEMAVRIGRAIGIIFGDANGGPPIIIGRDTRRSGKMLEATPGGRGRCGHRGLPQSV